MINYIKRLFSKPSAEVIALNELARSAKKWKAAKQAADHYSKLAEYHMSGITRLKKYLGVL